MKNRQLQHLFPVLHCDADHAYITQTLAFSILMRTFKNSITIKLALLNVIRMLLRVLYYPISTGRKEYHIVNPIIFLCTFYKKGKGSSIWFLRGKRRELASLGIQYQFLGTWRKPLLSKPLNPLSNHQLLVVTVAFPETLAPSETAIKQSGSSLSTTQCWNSKDISLFSAS